MSGEFNGVPLGSAEDSILAKQSRHDMDDPGKAVHNCPLISSPDRMIRGIPSDVSSGRLGPA
jgi:hypothetical protein